MLQPDEQALFIVSLQIQEKDLQQEIQQMFQQAKAIQFYLMSLIRRAFQGFSFSKNKEISLKDHIFDLLCRPSIQKKSKKIQSQAFSKVFEALGNNKLRKNYSRQKENNCMVKMQLCKLKACFLEWKSVINLQKKVEKISVQLRYGHKKQFLLLLAENHLSSQLRKLDTMPSVNLHAFYQQKLKTKYFLNLILYTKFSKISKIKLKRGLKIIMQRIKNDNQQCRQKVSLFRSHTIKKNTFFAWKEEYRTELSIRFNNQKLLWNFFNQWRDGLDWMVSQRQIETNNECIVQIYNERRWISIRKRAFECWRQYALQAIQNRKQNTIINKFTDLKYKQLLLRRCFNQLNDNRCQKQIIRQFYQPNLKAKVILAFKNHLQLSHKLENWSSKYNRLNLARKCIVAFRRFNQQQKIKVKAFLLGQYWKKTIFSFASGYHQKHQKALQYNQASLLLRSFYTFKNEVSYSQKQKFLIIWLNAKKPLQNWRKRWSVDRFIRQREWFVKKTILLQWQLQRLNKLSLHELTSSSNQISSPNYPLFPSNNKLSLSKNHKNNKSSSNFSNSRLTPSKNIQNSSNSKRVTQSKPQASLGKAELGNIMQTVARIRQNLLAEQAQQEKQQSSWPVVQTPTQSVHFSYSLQN